MNKPTNLVIALICLLLINACAEKQTTKKDSSFSKLISSEATLSIIQQNIDGYKIIDIRKYDDYKQNHISGAIQTWRPDYEDLQNNVKGIMAGKVKMETLLQNWGIKINDTLILYDGRGNSNSTRLWWILKQYGFENVKILDGSFMKWQKLNLPTDSISPKIKKTAIKLNNLDYMLYANLSDVKNHLENKGVLLDSRTIEEYEGTLKKGKVKRGGHIPNAIRFDWSELVKIGLNEDGTFRNKKSISEKLKGISINPEDPIIVYCQSGVRSASVTFVLSEIMGYKNIRNYDGSWLEWGNSELPIEYNPEKSE